MHGNVWRGVQIVKKIESAPTGAGDRPQQAVEIADSGAL